MLFNFILTASLAILSSALSAEARKHKTHDVIVGGAAGLVYTPNQVHAEPGDRIKFHFQFKNHTVTQSSFDEPCEPLKGGFDSGFMPVGMDDKHGPTFTIRVKDYDPIWVHCEQIDHCPSGMVFAVNAPKKGNTFKKFLKKAKKSGKDNYRDGGSYKRSDEDAEDDIEDTQDDIADTQDDLEDTQDDTEDTQDDLEDTQDDTEDAEDDVEAKRSLLSRITVKRDA